MITKTIGKVSFRLKEDRDLSWLENEGEVFSAIDSTGSGCLCLGIEKNGVKRFFKIAGVGTVEAEVDNEAAKDYLRKAVKINTDIRHRNLCRLLDSYEKDDLFVAVYEWNEGECLFDHWNFDKYDADKSLVPPRIRFRNLPKEKKLPCAEILFDFMEEVIRQGYLAVDLYDSSFMYDFESGKFTICDIDLFRKAPLVNEMGEDYYGTKRLKAPEENILGAAIDERTNVFTVGAIIHDMFTSFDVDNNSKRYEAGIFIPTEWEDSQLSEDAWNILMKATALEPQNRFATIAEFHKAWNKTL